MNILLSNDDGIDAPGIQVLYQFLSKQNELTLIAPDRNRSATSASLTLDRPLRVTQRTDDQFSVNGTPCDCVHLGTHRLMKTPPTMVIAGINHGANLGDDCLYSGTVAAAMEGRSLGYPAVAVSLAGKECLHYEAAAQVMLDLKNKIADHPLPKNIILNVNVPDIPFDQIKGIKVTRLGSRHRADTVIPETDPRGNKIYWFGPPSEPEDIGEMTDFNAIFEGYVSITPLVVDLTDYKSIEHLTSWIAK